MRVTSHEGRHTDGKAALLLSFFKIDRQGSFSCCVDVHSFIEILDLNSVEGSDIDLLAISASNSEFVSLSLALQINFELEYITVLPQQCYFK